MAELLVRPPVSVVCGRLDGESGVLEHGPGGVLALFRVVWACELDNDLLDILQDPLINEP